MHGAQHELNPLCVLDFFVHPSQQRKGYGKKLFDFMLRLEKIPAYHLAIDRPSEKSLKFLEKHYNLRNAIPQVNKFVVYQEFFHDRQIPSRNRRNKYNYDSIHNRTEAVKSYKSLPPIEVII